MNDRFKFRFYDNDKKIMIDEDTEFKMLLSEYGKDEWYCCFEAIFPTILDYFDYDEYDEKDFVIMQCTGLKDKNGKLIYEGDILGGTYGNLYIHYCDKCKQFQLKANDYGCMACEGDIHWCELVEDENELEVIGNIYENKKLLEDT